MSSPTEKTLWKWLRDGTARMRPKLHMIRVETSTKRGVLDVEGCYLDGWPFWLELKAGPAPASPSSLVQCEPLKPAQADFIRARAEAGGRSFVLYQVGRERFLVRGWTAMQNFMPRPTLQGLRMLAMECQTDAPGMVKACSGCW